MRRFRSGGVLALAAVLVVSACGASSQETTTATAQDAATITQPRPETHVVVHKRSPRASVIVPDNWSVDEEHGRLDGPASLSIWFGELRGQAWDSRLGRDIAFPPDMTALVARSPYVRVVDARTVRLGGVEAKQIDVVARRGDPRRGCPISDRYELSCVPITTFTPEPFEVQDVSVSLEPGEPKRLIDLKTRSGRLIIVVSGFSRSSQLSQVESILRTLEIG